MLLGFLPPCPLLGVKFFLQPRTANRTCRNLQRDPNSHRYHHHGWNITDDLGAHSRRDRSGLQRRLRRNLQRRTLLRSWKHLHSELHLQADPAVDSLWRNRTRRQFRRSAGQHLCGRNRHRPAADLFQQQQRRQSGQRLRLAIRRGCGRERQHLCRGCDRQDEYHQIEVQGAKPGLTARTSQSYYAQP